MLDPKDHAQLDLTICAMLRPYTMTPVSRANVMKMIELEPKHGLAFDKAMQRLRKQGLVRYEQGGWLYVVPPALRSRHAS